VITWFMLSEIASLSSSMPIACLLNGAKMFWGQLFADFRSSLKRAIRYRLRAPTAHTVGHKEWRVSYESPLH
jgi:hypothetical protein